MALREAMVESGRLRGIAGNNPIFTVFKGVPYAKPPIGDLRWKTPQPAPLWKSVKIADTYGPIAPQARHPEGSLYQKEFFQYSEDMSEDCLYLNIWTPAIGVDEKLPVLFWIHGGGYSGGYGSEPEFDGEGFCRRGVILVTFNYRLGALGFMAHPALSAESANNVSGNYGHLDQIAALKWVRRNIGAFGGDAGNITLCGQSAGAMSVQALICSPLTRGDVSRAILQSGGGIRPFGRELCAAKIQAEQVGQAFMESFKCSSLEEFRAVPAEKIVAAQTPEMRFASNVDQYVLTDDPCEMLLKNEYCDIPYLIGNTSEEMTVPFEPNQAAFIESARKVYGGHSDEYLSIVKTDDDIIRVSNMASSLLVANHAFAELIEKQGRSPTFVYYFDRQLPGDDHLGAFHSAELWYEFQTLYNCWRPFTGVDFDLSNSIAGYWANFAKNGNPNGEGLPQWIAYTKKQPLSMEFGAEIGMTEIKETKAQEFQKDFLLGRLD
jgi:para-nitrobenzyl esterase